MLSHHRLGAGGVVAAALLILTRVTFASSGGIVLHVDDNAPLGGNGRSWDSAYRFLQDALAAAGRSKGAVAEVRVAQGTYKPDLDEGGNVIPGDREATFQLLDGLTLRGGFAGIGAGDPNVRDFEVYQTVLSGDLLGDDGPAHANNDENSRHVLSGSGVTVPGILDGFRITGGNADSCLPGLPRASRGGGMDIDGGSVGIANCTFVLNSACAAGGAIFLASGELSARNCSFIRNRTTWNIKGQDFGQGGCAHLVRSSSSFTNCIFLGNSGPLYGGGILVNHGSISLLNDTFHANSAGVGGGLMVTGSVRNPGMATVTNSILWGNTAIGGGPEQQQIVVTIAGELEISHSTVQGWTGALGGVGNIGSDPLFVDSLGPGCEAGTDDLRLLSGSPCIDAADNVAVPEGIATDLDGNPRFVDDPEARDTGNPGGMMPLVDMGAYEFCRADANRDGIVDLLDLTRVVTTWGTCDAPGDVNADGIVNVLDLVSVVVHWGPCQQG
jgi:hypothetical protein